jgi:hypothetical protein
VLGVPRRLIALTETELTPTPASRLPVFQGAGAMKRKMAASAAKRTVMPTRLASQLQHRCPQFNGVGFSLAQRYVFPFPLTQVRWRHE